jgi:hypothetical protein
VAVEQADIITPPLPLRCMIGELMAAGTKWTFDPRHWSLAREGAIAGIMGGFITLIAWLRPKSTKKELSYTVQHQEVLTAPEYDNVVVTVDGERVDRLTLTTILFKNSGRARLNLADQETAPTVAIGSRIVRIHSDHPIANNAGTVTLSPLPLLRNERVEFEIVHAGTKADIELDAGQVVDTGPPLDLDARQEKSARRGQVLASSLALLIGAPTTLLGVSAAAAIFTSPNKLGAALAAALVGGLGLFFLDAAWAGFMRRKSYTEATVERYRQRHPN